MTPDDIEKAIHDSIAKALQSQLAPAVQTAVDAAVNGKVKALSAQMQPITEAWNKWLSWKRVAVVGVGMFIAMGSLISTAQQFWSFLSPHITVK
jgi:hypothetical protein